MKGRTKVRKELVDPWAVKGDKLISSYSYFASVQSSKALWEMGVVFICFIKKA